jgi:hypothetical protein
VFAYSNRTGDPQNAVGSERGLVVYHNKYADTRGWIKTSAAYMDKASENLIQKTLGEGLGLPGTGYAIFKDYVSGMEYMRSCQELVEKGLFVLLGGYQCHVFLDWRFVDGEPWTKVYEALNGGGVPSVQARFDEMFVVKEEVKSEKEEVKEKKATRKRAAKKPAEKSAVKEPVKRKRIRSAGKEKAASKIRNA